MEMLLGYLLFWFLENKFPFPCDLCIHVSYRIICDVNRQTQLALTEGHSPCAVLHGGDMAVKYSSWLQKTRSSVREAGQWAAFNAEIVLLMCTGSRGPSPASGDAVWIDGEQREVDDTWTTTPQHQSWHQWVRHGQGSTTVISLWLRGLSEINPRKTGSSQNINSFFSSTNN